MQRINTPTKRRRQLGSTITEFSVVFPFMVAAFFGTVGIGITMIRYMQALTVCRDLAHQYAAGVSFTDVSGQNIAIKLSESVGMTATGGDGVVIFSKIITVYQSDCTAASLASCGNLNQAVVINRQRVGNSALLTSQFATPSPSNIMDADGDVSAANYLNANSSVRAPLLTTLLSAAGTSQLQGDIANVTELYFKYPDISFLGGSTPAGVYTRFIY